MTPNKIPYNHFLLIAQVEPPQREDGGDYYYLENLLHDGLVLSKVDGNLTSPRALFSEASKLEPKNYLPYLFGSSCSGDAVGSLKQAIKKKPIL